MCDMSERYCTMQPRCEQAAEKALKAMLAENRHRGRTHACVLLCEALAAIGVGVPAEVVQAGRRLDPHYSDARYPNAVGGPPQIFYDRSLAEECMEWAETIRQFVKSNLP